MSCFRGYPHPQPLSLCAGEGGRPTYRGVSPSPTVRERGLGGEGR